MADEACCAHCNPAEDSTAHASDPIDEEVAVDVTAPLFLDPEDAALVGRRLQPPSGAHAHQPIGPVAQACKDQLELVTPQTDFAWFEHRIRDGMITGNITEPNGLPVHTRIVERPVGFTYAIYQGECLMIEGQVGRAVTADD